MSKVEEIGKEDKVWVPYSQWGGETINKLWSTIFCKLDPYLHTKTQRDKNSSTTYHKNRQGQIALRTCYNKMYEEGLFKGNKIRKKNGGSRMFSTSQYNLKNCCILIVVEQQIDSWIRVLPLISTLEAPFTPPATLC